MSSKKAMKLAQKQAFAKHRSNITNSRFSSKKINFSIKLKSQLVLYRVSDSQISKDKSLRFYQHYKIRNKHINSKFSKIYSCCYIFLMLFYLAFNYLFKKL